MTCKWNGSANPRTVIGRHDDECRGEECAGCLPCTEPHCRRCGIAHVNGTCAECVGVVRDDLHEIARMCDALPEEVEHRGIDGEAMVLLGPASDTEARGHLEASVAAGRVPADYLEAADHELHPLLVLGNWDSIWRDALEHDDAARVTIPVVVDYLDRQMTYMAGYPHVSFSDFASGLNRCRGHLEAILHDGVQRDTGAPCMTCAIPLERVWGDDSTGDGWRCPRCRQTSTEDQYRFAVMHLHREEALWLTDRDMQIRTGVKAGTVREWARRGDVKKKRDAGRVVYRVEDVVNRVA